VRVDTEMLVKYQCLLFHYMHYSAIFYSYDEQPRIGMVWFGLYSSALVKECERARQFSKTPLDDAWIEGSFVEHDSFAPTVDVVGQWKDFETVWTPEFGHFFFDFLHGVVEDRDPWAVLVLDGETVIFPEWLVEHSREYVVAVGYSQGYVDFPSPV